MVDQRILNFIKSSLQQGHDINTIQNYLLSQGFGLEDIHEAVSSIYGASHVHHIIDLSKTTVITIISAFLVVIITVLFLASMLGQGQAPPSLLDLSLSSDMESVKPGDNFVFGYNAIQTGNKKRFDVKMVYEVRDANNNLITSMEEEVAIETKVSATQKIKVPSEAKPGKYVLKATAIYGNKKASARINFDIKGAEPAVTEEKPAEQPSEQQSASPIEEDIPSVPIPSVQPEDPHLVTEEAIRSSTADVSKAGKLCDSLLELRDRDKCFEKIAENSNNPSLCSNIQSNSKRDTCYMNFAIEGDYSVCSKVENQYLKKSCDNLAALNT